MPRPFLSVGELAVRFGLEPVDIEWLLYRYARGAPWPELVQEIQALDYTPAEAECLARHIRDVAATHQVSLLGSPTTTPN